MRVAAVREEMPRRFRHMFRPGFTGSGRSGRVAGPTREATTSAFPVVDRLEKVETAQGARQTRKEVMAEPVGAPPSMWRGGYREAVRGAVLGLATSFWTRQLISSPTQISFSEGHAMA